MLSGSETMKIAQMCTYRIAGYDINIGLELGLWIIQVRHETEATCPVCEGVVMETTLISKSDIGHTSRQQPLQSRRGTLASLFRI